MKVARQFTPWNMLEGRSVPGGRCESVLVRGFRRKNAVDRPNHTVPLGRSFFTDPRQSTAWLPSLVPGQHGFARGFEATTEISE